MLYQAGGNDCAISASAGKDNYEKHCTKAKITYSEHIIALASDRDGGRCGERGAAALVGNGEGMNCNYCKSGIF